ncbi:hypothetical protein KC338_g159 [Hortaea werneckii]|nr:hypothetical protein KC338_g159 [Hortaea werneckii]
MVAVPTVGGLQQDFGAVPEGARRTPSTLRFIAAAEILDPSLMPAGRRFAGRDCRMRGRGRSIPLPLYTLQQRAPMQPCTSRRLSFCVSRRSWESGGNNARLRQPGLFVDRTSQSVSQSVVLANLPPEPTQPYERAACLYAVPVLASPLGLKWSEVLAVISVVSPRHAIAISSDGSALHCDHCARRTTAPAVRGATAEGGRASSKSRPGIPAPAQGSLCRLPRANQQRPLLDEFTKVSRPQRTHRV